MEPRSHFSNRNSEDKRVLEILEQYLIDQEAGNAPDRESIVALHPDISERLRDCFESIAAVESLAGGIESAAQSPAAGIPFPEFEDYTIRRELGRGGMGVVYEAEQISLSRRVALKVLPLAAVFDQKSLQRFRNEALAMAQLDHPNIINVYSVGCEKGVHYYSMQLVEGQSLSQVIRQLKGTEPDSPEALGTISQYNQVESNDSEEKNSGAVHDSGTRHSDSFSSGLSSNALSVGSAGRRGGFYRAIAKIGCQAAKALQHAHEMGIIHRDVKPSNLLLDAKGEIVVSDFGLATMQGDINLTATGDLLGTLRYMSPEQASGQPELVDHRTDVYSLGATMYELATHESAVKGSGRRQVLKNILNEKITPVSKINRAVPHDLETIIMKALSHAREHRYTTAWEMAEDLQRYLDDQPIQARRPTLRQRSAKWFRRNRWVAATAATFMFLLVAGSIASTVIIYRWYDMATTALARAIEAEGKLKKSNLELSEAVGVIELSNTKMLDVRELIQQKAAGNFEKGKRYFQEHSFDEAIAEFENSLDLDKTGLENHLWIARCWYQLRNFENAVEHATSCIEKIGHLTGPKRELLSFGEWEPRYERAVSLMARNPPTEYSPNIRSWDQDVMQQAIEDAEFGRSRAPENFEVAKLAIQVNFDFAFQTANILRLREVSERALELFRNHPDDRELFEIAMLSLWKLDRKSEFVRLYEQQIENLSLNVHGHLYLLRSLFHFQGGDKASGVDWYGRGIRWCLHRSPMYEQHERLVRNWLVETTAEQAGRRFDAWFDRYSWFTPHKYRIDSSELVGSAEKTQGSLFAQYNMNNECGSFWTPDYKSFGNQNHGVQLFWKPSGENPRLKLELFDTNVRGKEITNNGQKYYAASFQPGTHRLTANLTSSNDFAIVQFWWNGKRIGEPIDLYHPKPAQLGETDFGWVEIVEGLNVMEIELVGRNPNAVAVPAFGMDFIDLWPKGYVPGRTLIGELERRLRNSALRVLRVSSSWLGM